MNMRETDGYVELGMKAVTVHQHTTLLTVVRFVPNLFAGGDRAGHKAGHQERLAR